MEPRGYPAGGQYAAAPPVRSPESARAVWWILAGTNDEDSPLQISVLTFCKTKKGVRDMRKFLSILACSLIIVGCTPSEKDFIDMGRPWSKTPLKIRTVPSLNHFSVILVKILDMFAVM